MCHVYMSGRCLKKVQALLTVTRVMQGCKADQLTVTVEGLLVSEQFTAKGQWVDTTTTYLVWETALVSRITALEFHPAAVNMKIYPAVDSRGWFREDVTLVQHFHDTPAEEFQVISASPLWDCFCSLMLMASIQEAKPMCVVARCKHRGEWRLDEGPWRCCVLCERGKGRWYHVDCLGPSISMERILTLPRISPAAGGVPPWIYLSGSANQDGVEDYNETLWRQVRSLPIQRGYPEFEQAGLLSFESLLQVVRGMPTPANAKHTLLTLVADHIWSPVYWYEPAFRTLTRVEESFDLLLRASRGRHTYYRCPYGHYC